MYAVAFVLALAAAMHLLAGGAYGAQASGIGAAGGGGGTEYTLPIIGNVDVSQLSLPMTTVILGGMDGFNPCAFFVLFFLLSLLIHVHSRGRMALIGGTFVLFSGLFYFLFMAAWLNVFLIIGRLAAITSAAGIAALVIAVLNIKDFFFFERGVSLVISEKDKPKLFVRMRGLLHTASLSSMFFGAVVLAIAANSYELLCTAGFPIVFTRILTLHDLPASDYYMYILLYNIVYVIPLAGIVAVFTVTLGAKKLTEWQGRELKLVSGMMMLGMGGVLLFNPALMSNPLTAGLLLVSSLTASGLVVYLTRRRKAQVKG